MTPARSPGDAPDRARRIARPYCLTCYAALPCSGQAVVECAACHELKVLSDQRLFWTREPAPRRAERTAKIATVGLLVLIAWGVLTLQGASFGMGQGYGVGFPIVIAGVLWQTAEKLTRHKPYFRPAIFWGAILVVILFPFFVAALWPTNGVGWLPRAIVSGLFLAAVAIALAVRGLCRRLARWRDERILSAQLAHETHASAHP